jgi:ectoine hydroxylase-related dioxygenase (phytanoyl-CoA dioxygenase family)
MSATLTACTPYQEAGYTIVRDGLDAEDVARIRPRLDALIANLAPGQRMEWLVEPHVNAPDWTFWLELCRHPRILEQVAEAMGADELMLVMSHLIVKAPGDGLAVAWHQDITYWASVHGTEVCTVWLAVDDADVENACMHVIPSSHAERERMERIATGGGDLLGVRVAVTPEQEATAVACALRAGEFSIHDSFIIHGSAVNRSARRRAGYTMRYADAAKVKVDIKDHWVPVYYVHGDGANLQPGVIDLRPGRLLPPTPRAATGGSAPLTWNP